MNTSGTPFLISLAYILKVAFSENFLGFTDWYEQVEYGDVILSWFIGMPVKEHAKKVEILRGGPGAPFETGR